MTLKVINIIVWAMVILTNSYFFQDVYRSGGGLHRHNIGYLFIFAAFIIIGILIIVLQALNLNHD